MKKLLMALQARLAAPDAAEGKGIVSSGGDFGVALARSAGATMLMAVDGYALRQESRFTMGRLADSRSEVPICKPRDFRRPAEIESCAIGR